METRLESLFQKFLTNSCTPAELNLLFQYFGSKETDEIKALIFKHFTKDLCDTLPLNDRLDRILLGLYEKINFDD